MTVVTVNLAVGDIAKARRLARSDVPECPVQVVDGVLDVGPDRWRYRDGRLLRYVRHGHVASTLVNTDGTHPPGIVAIWDSGE